MFLITRSQSRPVGKIATLERAIRSIAYLIFSAVLLAPQALAGDRQADTVLTNGKIYTVTEKLPWAEALAMEGGNIIAIGSNADVQAFVGPDTEQIDLDGRMAMPGLIDAHLHPILGATKDLYECNFPFTATPEEIAGTISSCVADRPQSEWIRGGQWTSDFFVNNAMDSPRRWLDKVSGDKAVVLTDDSGHNHWLNSLALERLGITTDTPNPPGGKIGREKGSSQPNGILEEAFAMVENSLPDWTQEQYLQAAKYAVETANRYGITGMKDAMAKEAYVKAFYTLDNKEGLTANIAVALDLAAHGSIGEEDILRFSQMRDQFSSERVHTEFVKIFLDGVPTAAKSAAMLGDYQPDNDGEPVGNGSLHFSSQELAEAVQALDSLGFTIKIHTAGDRAVRVALDAIAVARKENGNTDLRHELAHAGYIDNSDLERFAELNVAADFSPYLWFPSPIMDSVIGAVGARGEYYWPGRDLIDKKATIIAGSDWPSAVPNMDPWTGMEALVSRRDPRGEHPGALWPEQSINIEEVIAIYTRAGAQALKLENETGSLEVGKSADIIVLNHNLLDIPTEAISDTEVAMTFFEGELVYIAD